MSADFNPNSIDATLARILQNQEDIGKQLKEHHTDFMRRITDHEADDLAKHAEVVGEIAGLKRWKYMVVGGATAIIFGLEHGFRWLFPGGPADIPKH